MNIVTDYWDRKILNWEKKYDSVFGKTLLARATEASKIINPHLANKRILEVGCGSGTLLNLLSKDNIKDYTGIDTSQNAIEEANKKYAHQNNINFLKARCYDINFDDYDVVISLGLTDWIDQKELEFLIEKSLNKVFIHSFSINEKGIHCFIHKLFSHYKYSETPKGYPKKYTLKEIEKLTNTKVNIHKTKSMSFGVLVNNVLSK